MSTLEDFAHWITGGCPDGWPSGQRVVFYGSTAPDDMSLEEFAEKYEKFILNKKHPKREREAMDSKEAFSRIREVLRDYHRFDKVEVIDPNGRLLEVNEYWIRAFQVVANRASDEEFEWLKKNFKIFSGPKRHELMQLRRDGKFSNEFEPGFFDASANMAFEIL